MKFSKDWFIKNGWKSGAEKVLVPVADALMKKLGSEKYVEKQLRRDYSEWLKSYELRTGGYDVAEAIEAQSDAEQKNLTKVRAKMAEVMSCPVIISAAVMPDSCPAGSEYGSIPVGGVVVTENEVLPSAHSMDICCSMYASFYFSELGIEEELDHLERVTRFGPGMRKDAVHHPVLDEAIWHNEFLRGLEKKAIYHMADQGDGNHFAYLGEVFLSNEIVDELVQSDVDSENLREFVGSELKVLVTHHGSRGLGATVYTRGMAAAVKQTRKKNAEMPESACWLDLQTPQGEAYWDALQYLSRWTKGNHQAVHRLFLEAIGSDSIWEMGNEHNFVWKHEGKIMHGKGATPAWNDGAGLGLLGLIPLNMAEPILLVRGKANGKFQGFAPHGAGRNLSRNALLKTFRKEGKFSAEAANQEIKARTANISVRWYQGVADVTETPAAYKNAASIIEQIEKFDLASVVCQIRPRGSIMAGRSEKSTEKPMTPKQKRQIQHRKERRTAKQGGWEQGEYE